MVICDSRNCPYNDGEKFCRKEVIILERGICKYLAKDFYVENNQSINFTKKYDSGIHPVVEGEVRTNKFS